MGKELRRAQHVVADILAAMTRIIDEDHSVRFKDGHINLIAVFSRFTQGDLLLIAAYLGEPDNVGSEVLAKLKEAMKW